LGKQALDAVNNLDLYLVRASLMMGATMLIVGNLLADLLLEPVEPRIKLEDLK
jgi:peptide/nickel transport system permease protein